MLDHQQRLFTGLDAASDYCGKATEGSMRVALIYGNVRLSEDYDMNAAKWGHERLAGLYTSIKIEISRMKEAICVR